MIANNIQSKQVPIGFVTPSTSQLHPASLAEPINRPDLIPNEITGLS